MKLELRTLPTVAILAILLAVPASARADIVGDWNAFAVEATVTGGRPGPSGIIDIAMVHAAIYDAVQAIKKDFQPYYVEIPGASGSPKAAAAKAAHDVLVSRFPAQAGTLFTKYQQSLVDHGLFETDPGVAVGTKAAAGIIALRACDGSFPASSPPFTAVPAPGVWRPTLPNFAPFLATWLGFVTPFTLTRPSQFRAEPPPALTSRQYARDYNEVKSLGAATDSDRTPEQTQLALFWNLNYIVVWNQVLRNIATARVDNISDSARLFALADMAIADAVITAWSDKFFYGFWRPITAIQLGDTDGNSRTNANPDWLPFIPTPAYPEYTSGANNVTAAATAAVSLFFGRDRLTFSVTSTNTNPNLQNTLRTFRRLSDAQEEVVDARVYEGIHFRFGDTAARKQGIQVARWAFENFLRPLDDHKNNDDNDHHGDRH